MVKKGPEPGSERHVPSSALPCPECLYAGRGGDARIGNRRSRCGTCNRFWQTILRATQKRLRQRHGAEYDVLRAQTEMDLYPQIVADWKRAHPVPSSEVGKELGL